MELVSQFEIAGTEAVKKLRINKLHSGHPFMINSTELPSDQCYLEYPDGIIKLVTYSMSSKDFIVIKELSTKESSLIRNKYKLPDA